MPAQLLRFGAAGIAGLVVDTAVLYALLAVLPGHLLPRLGSFLCAVWTTWRINRRFTFHGERGGSVWHEWLRYLAAMSGGGLVNLIAYEAVMSFVAAAPWLPAAAVAAGSIAGMSVNFLSAKFWVFRRRHG